MVMLPLCVVCDGSCCQSVIAGLICALIAAPVEVIQFIYMGKIVDDVALQGGISSLKEYIALLLLLYLAEGVATALQVLCVPRVPLRTRRCCGLPAGGLGSPLWPGRRWCSS